MSLTKKEYRALLFKELRGLYEARKRARGKNRAAMDARLAVLREALDANVPRCEYDGEPVTVLVMSDVFGVNVTEHVMHSEYDEPPRRASAAVARSCTKPKERDEAAVVLTEVAA